MFRKNEIFSAFTLAEMLLGDGWSGANLVSGRHRGKGDITFANGHVEAITSRFGANLVNLYAPPGRNAAFCWLQTSNRTLQLQ